METALQNAINRRTSHRFDVVLPIVAGSGVDARPGVSANMSEGGALLEVDGAAPAVGSSIEVAFATPDGETVAVEAEVRWAVPGQTSKVGVMFRRGHQRLVALLVAGVLGGAATTASGVANASTATATTVPTFDPNADVVMDMDAGPERPDSHSVTQAFSRQYDAIDACVVDFKGGRDTTLEGEAKVEILLNPKGARPLGVNTTLPGSIKKDRELHECLRAAVATADYPSYDGPPVVVEFEVELDPGYEEVEAE
jgi:hypothetical protein